MLQYAETLENKSLYGQVFEVLVHKLAHDKSLELDVRDSQDNFGTSSNVKMTTGCSVKMGNGDDNFTFLTETQKWTACLTFLRKKATKTMYWYPGSLHFPVIDSILIHKGVAHFLQITVASTHSLDWVKLGQIRDALRANKAIKYHKFKYVVVTPRTTVWGTFKARTSGVPASSGLPTLSMCHAHIKTKFD